MSASPVCARGGHAMTRGPLLGDAGRGWPARAGDQAAGRAPAGRDRRVSTLRGWRGGDASAGWNSRPLTGGCSRPGSVEACRQLGIGRKTGFRWRSENGGLPPHYLRESSRSSRYLSLLERRDIASLRERGLTIREIGRCLGRAPSTVSRELRRNSRPHDYGRYNADLAPHRCRARAVDASRMVHDHRARLPASSSPTPSTCCANSTRPNSRRSRAPRHGDHPQRTGRQARAISHLCMSQPPTGRSRTLRQPRRCTLHSSLRAQ